MFFYFLIVQSFLVVVHGRKLDLLNEVQNDEHDAFHQEQLDMHNAYRRDHNVPPMTLDATLTQHAQDFAQYLADNDLGLKHCGKIPGCNNYGEGENLARFRGLSPSKATENWFNEIAYYDFCSTSHPLRRPGHAFEVVGHFTQVVWKASTLLGIGIATTSDGEMTYVVGRYSPGGNVYGTDQYKNNVLVPNSASDTYQLNCNAVNGGFSDWFGPSTCTRTCGGGVTLMKRNCDNPKPSFNGRDCEGENLELVSQEWCNALVCHDDMSYLDQQCQERGYPPNSKIYDCTPCIVYCHDGEMYQEGGAVDAGTRCKYNSTTDGACVNQVCEPMTKYRLSSGQTVTGSWTEVRSDKWYRNRFLYVPNGATDVTVINHNESTCTMMFVVKDPTGRFKSWCPALGGGTSGTVRDVSFTYDKALAKLTIAAPPSLTSTYTLIINCWPEEAGTGDFSWSFTT